MGNSRKHQYPLLCDYRIQGPLKRLSNDLSRTTTHILKDTPVHRWSTSSQHSRFCLQKLKSRENTAMLQEFTATWHNIQMDSLLLSNQNHFQNRQIIFKDFQGLGYAAFKFKWSQGPKVPWIFARPTEEISISCCTAHSSKVSECGQCHVVSIRSSWTQTQCSYQQLSAAC